MATTQQTAPAQEAGRPQPQTTIENPGGPFIRHSQPGRGPIYNVTGGAFSGIVTQPLVAKPGYFRNFRVTHTLTTGGTITSGTLQADAPYNLNSLIQLKDAFGTVLISGGGYEVSNLIGLYGGGFGVNNGSNLATNLPSYAALSATTGAGTFSYALPLEFSKGYGVLSGANASLLPTLQFSYNTFAALFSSSATGTQPTIGTTVDADFYWLPEGVAVEPPGLGSTRQWIQQQANPSISSASSTRVQLPRLGGFLDTIILEVRDSTGARTDQAWPSRLQLFVDGVPLIDSTMAEIYDDMWIQFGAVARPSGVIAFSRKTSLNQQSLGLFDTGEQLLSTNPGTLVEVNFSPAGTITNSPATMTVLVGQIVPTGSLIQGLPEV